jgi:tetratricopeptide (TPR) repeat protein
MLFDWNWLAAESGFKRAIDLNPNYATAHHWYAEYLTAMGRHEEALVEIKQAQELDPLSAIIHRDVGWHYYCARRYDQAIAQLRTTLKIGQASDQVHWLLGFAYAKKAMYAEAISELQKAVELSSSNSNKAMLGYVYASAGRKDEAQQILRTLDESSNEGRASPLFIATIYGELGNKEEAFAWLEKAYDEHSGLLVYLNVVPMLDSLRADQRFRLLAQRVGLPN